MEFIELRTGGDRLWLNIDHIEAVRGGALDQPATVRLVSDAEYPVHETVAEVFKRIAEAIS